MQPIEVPNTKTILASRGKRNTVDPWSPYSILAEPERGPDGRLLQTGTVFLTNRECPFRCLMCDLWKNTTLSTPPAGAIPHQVQTARQRLPPTDQIKLYNSGNFFDAAAFPPSDRQAVADLVGDQENVVVENHPKLCGNEVVEFQQSLGTALEVAMGLETSHAPTLARLNKQMTLGDFERACRLLLKHSIRVRAFVLLRPPWTSEQEGIQRAVDSVRFAFDQGVDCCAIIPTRLGNGIMKQLHQQGSFVPPSLRSLEGALDQCLAWGEGRVFADLWDLTIFSDCDLCFDQRLKRLEQMNLQQRVLPSIQCSSCCKDGAS